LSDSFILYFYRANEVTFKRYCLLFSGVQGNTFLYVDHTRFTAAGKAGRQ
jgi:hypothetical protein